MPQTSNLPPGVTNSMIDPGPSDLERFAEQLEGEVGAFWNWCFRQGQGVILENLVEAAILWGQGLREAQP